MYPLIYPVSINVSAIIEEYSFVLLSILALNFWKLTLFN